MALDASRTSLAAIATSAADLDACYTAWNARSYGWEAGPTFAADTPSRSTHPWTARLEARTIHLAHAAYARIERPIRTETPPQRPHARPLAGLRAFRNAVHAELRFLDRAAPGEEHASNATYLAAFWAETLYALLTYAPLYALNMDVDGVRISIVAHRRWIRLVPTKFEALCAEFRDVDAQLDANDLPTEDVAISSASLLRIADEVLRAAHTQTPRPALELALLRLAPPAARAAPPVSHPAYWHAAAHERASWRLDAICAQIRARGVAVRFGTRPLAAGPNQEGVYLPLPRPPPASVGQATQTLNLDASALIALVSDLVHASHMDARAFLTHPNRALHEQSTHEAHTPLFSVLGAACPAKMALVATRESLAKLQHIAHTFASPTELQRTEALVAGDPTAFWAHSRWRDTPIAQRLCLPVSTASTTHGTYDADAAACAHAAHLHAALNRMAHAPARAKSLAASPHTTHALQWGLTTHVTTLTAHAHGVAQLAAATHDTDVPHDQTPAHCVIFVLRPRSLCGCAAGIGATPAAAPEGAPRSAPPPHSPPSPEVGMRKASPPASPELAPSDTPSSPFGSPRPTRPTRWARLAHWATGPPTSTLAPIQHYRWWPFAHVEATFARLTTRLAWHPPRETHLPRFCAPEVEAFELLPSETQRPAPVQRGAAWLGKVYAEVLYNRVHYAALGAVCIAWLFAFAVLVDRNWFHAAVRTEHGWAEPQYLDCTAALWLRNDLCALNGAKCAPFQTGAQPFRCPSGCASTTLLNPRTVGGAQYNYQPLVVGGGPQSAGTATPYRADSFVCAAAQHAGVIGSRGGCGMLRLVGAYANYTASTAHEITSFPFPSVFPASFVVEHAEGRACDDTRWKTYVLNAVFSALVGLVVRPQPIVLLFIFAIVGFWHVNLVSELRDFPPPVGEAAGDFGPHLFVTYAAWRIAIRYVWPAFAHVPLEFGIGTLGLWWVGVLLDVVFADVPLQRLEGHDIMQQPGGLASLIVVILVVVCIAINQVRVIRAAGCLPKYLALYLLAGVILGLCAAVPGEGVRLHHYVIGIALLPACGFPTRISMLCCALLFGMYTNGVARWGFDGLIQDKEVIRGDAVGASALPTFATPALVKATVVQWNPLPAPLRTVYDSFLLLVDDVLRYQGSGTEFDLRTLYAQYNSTGSTDAERMRPDQLAHALRHSTHYLRLAYAKAGSAGDFTMPAQAWLNGTFRPPPPGRT